MEIRDIIVELLDFFHFNLVLIISVFMLIFGILLRLIKALDEVSSNSVNIKDTKDKESFNSYYDI